MKTLAKEHGLMAANQGAPNVWTLDTFTQGWRVLAPAGIFVSETFFDLAGMSQREKTLFFEAATVQDLLNPQHTGGAAGDSMVIVDLMSTKSLTDTQLSNFYIYGNFAYQGVLTYDETIYARVNQYVVDLDTAAWGSFIQVSTNQIGSLSASASDRIYSYRIVALGTPTTASDIDIFAARHVLQAKATEEPDFQYLMRLRRSYELAQSHDED
jgi:hypothetical protein